MSTNSVVKKEEEPAQSNFIYYLLIIAVIVIVAILYFWWYRSSSYTLPALPQTTIQPVYIPASQYSYSSPEALSAQRNTMTPETAIGSKQSSPPVIPTNSTSVEFI